MADPAGQAGDHVLPDVLGRDLHVVFCGSAAGKASARAGAYYAGPGNLFWPTLHRVGLTAERLEPREFRTVARYGIGLTDMAKAESGGDHELSPAADDPAALRRKIARHRPKMLSFVGKRAARVFLGRPVEYGIQSETIGATLIFLLPSPSGRARRFWDESWWFDLARRLGA
ncbi:MAG: mismatch-specific DNA-glycosylase [Alphaproteobacteria bacterium]